MDPAAPTTETNSPETETKSLRLHIGNISPALHDKKDFLETRLAKFGEVVSPLALHSKPLQDHYFGFITLKLTNSDHEKLKSSLNGIQFMGMKLTINVAKQDFQTAWAKDSTRQDTEKSSRIKRNNIALARLERITEASTPHRVNTITGEKISGPIAPNNSSLGYAKSCHTYHDMAGNTKHKPPPKSLVGSKSYGADTEPLARPNLQQYSNLAGGSELIKGRHRKTARPVNHIVKRQQTLRTLVNGELKLFKGYKTKLWGVEKRSVLELAYSYSNGVWRSGDDHIIERVSDGPVKCGISGEAAREYGEETRELASLEGAETGDLAREPRLPARDLRHPSRISGNLDNDEDDLDIDLALENSKNKSVLASLFTKFDFDKPLDVEENVNGIDEEDIVYDTKGRKGVVRYDYEVRGGLDSDEDTDDNETYDVNKAQDLIDSYKQSVEQPAAEVYYDENDEGNDLEDVLGRKYTTEGVSEVYDKEHEELSDLIDLKVTEDFTDNVAEPQSITETVPKVQSVPAKIHELRRQHVPAKIHELRRQHVPEAVPESVPGKISTIPKTIPGKLHDLRREVPATLPDSDDEFIPNFGTNPNNTETLRTLFNPAESSGFKLALSEDDEDVDQLAQKQLEDLAEQQKLLKQIKKKQEAETLKLQTHKFGLFWPHFDSPFLQTQSQLKKIDSSVKLPGDEEKAEDKEDKEGESAYEKWFWQQRGELSRECKRRRRDVVRVFNKKSKV